MPRLVCSECNAPNAFVRLYAREPGVKPDARCGGPVVLSREEWKTILQSIRVQSNMQGFVFGSSKGPVEAAFTDEEIEYLSKTLEPAFRQARPDDLVVFGFARLLAPEVEEVSTGGWCLQGANLILLLANHRFGVSMPRIHDLLWKDPLRSQVADTYDFVAGDHQIISRNTTLNGYSQQAGPKVVIDSVSISPDPGGDPDWSTGTNWTRVPLRPRTGCCGSIATFVFSPSSVSTVAACSASR